METLRERLERLNRSGHFLQSPNPKQERERAFGNTPSLYAKKFGSQPGQTPEIQLAKALLNQSLEGIRHSPIRIHELDFLIRSIPPLLAPEEQLGFLSTFLQKIPSTASDLRDRIEKAIQKTFSKNPELAQKYSGKATFWRRLTRSLPDCDLILGRLARQK
ncbi:hypothetical protein EBT16_05700 [bacterium]|nr:hypothetical protein [bacterium]